MSPLSDICAIVLAGGFGTRLRSVVPDRPKVLATVCGRPFLVHLLDQLRQAGIRKTILCTGYMADQIECAFGQSYGAMELIYSRENHPLGTAGAIATAGEHCEAHSLLALNGDSYCAADLKRFAADHFARQARASILLTHMNDASRFGRVNVAADGRVTRFDEKCESAGPGLINAGIYLIERRLTEIVPRRRAVSIEHEIFPLWIGHGLFGHVTLAPFIDIGTPESYAMAQNFFAREAA